MVLCVICVMVLGIAVEIAGMLTGQNVLLFAGVLLDECSVLGSVLLVSHQLTRRFQTHHKDAYQRMLSQKMTAVTDQQTQQEAKDRMRKLCDFMPSPPDAVLEKYQKKLRILAFRVLPVGFFAPFFAAVLYILLNRSV